MTRRDGGARLAEMTAKAREDMAAKLFEESAVLEKAAEAARKGLGAIELHPPEPADLRNTEAVRKLAAILTKHGLKNLEWVDCRKIAADSRSPLPYYALRIWWAD